MRGIVRSAATVRDFLPDAVELHEVNVVRDEVPVANLHATLLHLLGMDHTKLTFRSSGLDMRLTGVQGELVPGMLA